MLTLFCYAYLLDFVGRFDENDFAEVIVFLESQECFCASALFSLSPNRRFG